MGSKEVRKETLTKIKDNLKKKRVIAVIIATGLGLAGVAIPADSVVSVLEVVLPLLGM